MTQIVVPNTFTGQTNPQLPWIDSVVNAIVSAVNGNLENDNIKSTAAIAQSKIADLPTDLAARVLDTGDTMAGALLLKFDSPYVRLIGTEASFSDWRAMESGGPLLLQINTGTEAVPVWATKYTFEIAGGVTLATSVATKTYVDTYSRSLAFGSVTKTDGNFSTTSTTFADVTGLALSVTTGARRCRVNFSGTIDILGATPRDIAVQLAVDTVGLGGTDGFVNVTPTDAGRYHNGSFSFVTGALTAAAHLFQIQMKTNSGTAVMHANTDKPAILQVEELPF